MEISPFGEFSVWRFLRNSHQQAMASFQKVLQCQKKMLGNDDKFHPESIEVNIGGKDVTIKNDRDINWKDILAKAGKFTEGDVKTQCAAFKGWMNEKKWAGKSKATDVLVAAKKPKLVDAASLFVKKKPQMSVDQAFAELAPSETAVAVRRAPAAPSASTVHQAPAASSETEMLVMAPQMMMMQQMMGSMQQMMFTAQSSNILVLQDEAKRAYINDNKEKIIKEAARQLIKRSPDEIREEAIDRYVADHENDPEFVTAAKRQYIIDIYGPDEDDDEDGGDDDDDDDEDE